ncbi:putative multidrug resistance protein mdtD [Glarea lozoyensis 74030]|uniref:Putative multidrug resistance protein mdtD n=1 Tax=Glarea lozoyensis (strain ATCC 74030 / MF5533) TaxID=1104152 RepID=H0EPS1_GLAL7|nr:putative multidrug resistance protein mdtD [Glarea lozoyensis 74030]
MPPSHLHSVYGLTSGAALLMAGSIADLVGARNVELVGILLLSTFVLAQSFSSTGIQFIVFRALQGVALAMHIPASIDWVGGGLASGGLAILAYVLAILSADLAAFKRTTTVVLFV